MTFDEKSDSTNTDLPSVGACAAHGDLDLLQAALQISREWVERLPPQSPQRATAVHLGQLVEHLIDNRCTMPLAMSNVRALLCTNCRNLNAAHGECNGRSLNHCLLIRKADR